MIEPALSPIRAHSDDRRTAWLELLGPLLPGDLSVTWVHRDAILGWHRHEKQDDYMTVTAGALKVGCWMRYLDAFPGSPDESSPGDGQLIRWFTLDARNPQMLRIPAGWWHGYQSIGDEAACVVTYITRHYDPQDEGRCPIFHGPDFVRVPR